MKSETINNALYIHLFEIMEEYPDAKSSHRYVDYPAETWTVPVLLKAHRIKFLCSDYSIESIQVTKTDDSEPEYFSPHTFTKSENND